MLRGGTVWSVGDGNTIRSFLNAWLPGRYECRLGTRPVSRDQAAVLLSDWMDLESKQWKESAVRGAFNRMEDDWVMDIPIPLVPRRDELVWPFDRKGTVTVRSTYHHLRSNDRAEPPSPDSNLSEVRPDPALWDVI